MRRPAPILLLALAAQSCNLELPAPVLSSVDPSAVSNSGNAPVTVHGANFFAWVSADFDAPGQSLVNAAFYLAVIHPDGRIFPLTGVTLVSENAISAVVPSVLSPQTYSLFLSDPRSRTAFLPGALQIFQGDCATNGVSCLSGNPCSITDTCQGHKCIQVTSYPDDTPCQLVCPTPGRETCQGGVCTVLPGGC